MSIEHVIAAIQKNNNFLVITHANSEGDALGSELALCLLLRSMGKKAVIINEDPVPEEYAFLPNADLVQTFHERYLKSSFDAYILVDCAELSRCGELARMPFDAKPVINIDHHISNTNFGTVNWVDPVASSASEMVYRLYKKMEAPFTYETAMQLYVGIMTDTGSFKYSNTLAATHAAAAELIASGIDVAKVHRQVYESVPLKDMVFLSKLLPALKTSLHGKIIWFSVKASALKKQSTSFDLSEHLLAFGRSVRGVEVVAVFKENLGVKNEIRINLRSQGSVDVNAIARSFGGGGHTTASGATARGKISVVERNVVRAIRTAVEALGNPS
ncbi:MAG TPA: bifunctional oligoribonuclease/PAP phosphatase NrnA [Candidatus Omnitrophota bacterium]|nr:bifunctional oligoribonuclease/PAP phosphatase NrnA [Candidatus Omnitrophota bacterium]